MCEGEVPVGAPLLMDTSVERIVEIDVVDREHVLTRIYGDDTYESMALLVCDFVRHIALMRQVDEDDVWHWVDLERYHHTTDVVQVN